MIPGRGPSVSPIMVVMDYPSQEELMGKQCCIGSAGRVIGNYFKDHGENLDNYYRTFYIKDKFTWPKGKKNRQLAIAEADFPSWNQLLAKEIEDIRPNVILSVGEFPTRFISGRKPVSKLRGSILPLSEEFKKLAPTYDKITRVVPIFSPREINIKWQHNSYTSLDVGRAVALRNREEPIKEDFLLWICWTAKALSNWWNDRGKNAKYLTLDIETLHGFITCISFSHDGYEGLSIPLVDSRTTPLDRALIFRLLSEILKSKVPKVNQNILYDDSVTHNWGLQIQNIIGDTMLLAHTIYPELPKGLDFLTTLYTEISYYKDEGRDFNPKEGYDTLYYYNAKDSVAAWRVYKAQVEDAKEEGVWGFYEKKVFPLYDIYKRSDRRGIRIDETERTILRTKYEEMLRARRNFLREQVNEPKLKYNSPKQIAKLVYEDLALPKQYKFDHQTGRKTISTDEETLEELILNHCEGKNGIQQILWSILWCRKLHKIIGYINIPIHPDGRIRKLSKLTGTKSGRTSNSKTIDVEYYTEFKTDKKGNVRTIYDTNEIGFSFQTLPKHGFEVGTEFIGKDIRKMYVPSPGYKFIQGDGGQAEARVVCVLAEDWESLAEMNRKKFKINNQGLKDDLHTKTAMLVLSKEFDEITESDRQDFGKKPRHAGNYDMGAKRLSLMAHISFTEATQVLATFHSATPRIREVFHWIIRSIVSNIRKLSTPHGRQRQFFGKMNDDTYKEAYSWIPQAVVSDHTKFSVVTPLDEMYRNRAYFLDEAHDSAMFEVPTYLEEEFIEKFAEFFETPIDFSQQGSLQRDYQLVIPAEIAIGENWYDMRKVKR